MFPLQGILQTCHDLKPLRDEIYCQVVKQSTGVQDPDSLSNLRNWQVLACLCCSFLPSRNILRYIRFHIKRCVYLQNYALYYNQNWYPSGQNVKFFIYFYFYFYSPVLGAGGWEKNIQNRTSTKMWSYSIPKLIKIRANLWNDLIKPDFNWFGRLGCQYYPLKSICVWYQMKGKLISNMEKISAP